MRYIVYLLLAANVLYPGWNLLQAQSGAQSVQSFSSGPEGVRTLVMLKEGAGNKAPDTEGEEGRETESTADGQDGVRTLVMLKEVAGNKAPDTEVEEGRETESTADGQKADGDTALDADKQDTDFLVQVQQPDARLAPVCKALGPFDEFAEAQAVSERLGSMGLEQPVLRSVESQVVSDYWVYLPGKGQGRSRKAVRQLKAKNINDYYVYDASNYLISLGTFRTVGRAEKRQAKVRRLGMDAVLEKRYKSRVEHWLDMLDDGKYDEQLRIITVETPGLQIDTNPCMSMAAK